MKFFTNLSNLDSSTKYLIFLALLTASYIAYRLIQNLNKARMKDAILNNVIVPEVTNMKTKKELNVMTKSATYIAELCKNNGLPDDSVKKFWKDMFGSYMLAFMLGFVLLYVTKKKVILVVTILLAPFLPVLIRKMAKKEYEEEFVNSFHKFIDYLILYTSGGVNVQKAVEEIEKFMPDTDVLKPFLTSMVTHQHIGGLGTNNYVDNLRLLNKTMQIDIVDDFIDVIEIQTERGTPLVEALQSRQDYIKQKKQMKLKGDIAQAETAITMYKTALCTMPAMAMFIIPPMIQVFSFF